MFKTTHNPVLIKEVLQIMEPKEGIFIDATFGAGGYTQGLIAGGCEQVIAFDQDKNAEKYFLEIDKQYPGRINFIHDNFQNISTHITKPVDGVVFDIGVSSMQLDQAERGFSFSKNGPLDMRMDTTQDLTAEYIVNTYEEKDLADLIFRYGGERKSRYIARAISNQRSIAPITNTLELASIVAKAVGHYKDTIHPATRTFQAIRIEVNSELSALEAGLRAAASCLKIGGKMIVVTFHSLEDIIVKNYFAELCNAIPNNNRHMPSRPITHKEVNFVNITRKAIKPGDDEIFSNPRARSAKLRAIQRVS